MSKEGGENNYFDKRPEYKRAADDPKLLFSFSTLLYYFRWKFEFKKTKQKHLKTPLKRLLSLTFYFDECGAIWRLHKVGQKDKNENTLGYRQEMYKPFANLKRLHPYI